MISLLLGALLFVDNVIVAGGQTQDAVDQEGDP